MVGHFASNGFDTQTTDTVCLEHVAGGLGSGEALMAGDLGSAAVGAGHLILCPSCQKHAGQGKQKVGEIHVKHTGISSLGFKRPHSYTAKNGKFWFRKR